MRQNTLCVTNTNTCTTERWLSHKRQWRVAILGRCQNRILFRIPSQRLPHRSPQNRRLRRTLTSLTTNNNKNYVTLTKKLPWKNTFRELFSFLFWKLFSFACRAPATVGCFLWWWWRLFFRFNHDRSDDFLDQTCLQLIGHNFCGWRNKNRWCSRCLCRSKWSSCGFNWKRGSHGVVHFRFIRPNFALWRRADKPLINWVTACILSRDKRTHNVTKNYLKVFL